MALQTLEASHRRLEAIGADEVEVQRACVYAGERHCVLTDKSM